MKIDREMKGWVIGKKGRYIREIEEKSGVARIRLEDCPDVSVSLSLIVECMFIYFAS